MDSPMPSMPNLNPQMPQQQMPVGSKSHTGLIVTIIAVVLVLVAGGVYYMMFWQGAAAPEVVPPAQVQNQATPVADSAAAIDADLGATEDLDVDAEFKDIDADLKTL
jgi:flagellar basal body-associated protein FliL